jgi:hypothetical protein
MDMETLHVRVTFIEQALGTTASDPNLHETYVASKAPDAMKKSEEVDAFGVDAVVDKGKTIFPKLEDGTPFVWDYQWKGYFKESIGFLNEMKKRNPTVHKSDKHLPRHKHRVDGLLFIEPRKIPLLIPDDKELGELQRSLRVEFRGSTLTSISHSETVPAGTSMEFDIVLFDESMKPYVIEALEYGKYHGTLQWRNAGYGRFEYEIL